MGRELRVEMGSDAYTSCFTHALSTEHEEIMGLLIGTFEGSASSANSVICKVFMSMVLIRSDKRKDRVEIPVEMMAGVSAEVDAVKKETGIDDLQVRNSSPTNRYFFSLFPLTFSFLPSFPPFPFFPPLPLSFALSFLVFFVRD